MGPPGQPLTAQRLRDAALIFDADTGLGADQVAPRAYARLPQAVLEALALRLHRVEMEGKWP